MRAGWFERPGPAAEVIQVGDIPDPHPGPGEVLVRLHASGINPSDYKKRGNVSISQEFPRIVPHSDGAGFVAALGPGVAGFSIGDRVWVYNAQWGRAYGTAAEYVCLPERRVKPLPKTLSFRGGACLGIPAMTGLRCVDLAGPLKDRWVYVPGATGRVGAYALQFAKWRGANVVASTGGGEEAKAELASLGADIVLDRNLPDLGARILHATGSRGVDHIVEVNLPGNIALDEKILAEGGSIVSFGAASAPSVAVTQTGRRARNMSLHFVFVYMLNEETFERTCETIVEIASTGMLIHRIAGAFPLADLASAHAFAETTSGLGHVIVEM